MAKFCPSCGKSLDDNAQFCDGCGAAQTPVAPAQNVQQPQAPPPPAPQQAAQAPPPPQAQIPPAPAPQPPPAQDQQAQQAQPVFDPADIEKNKSVAALAYLGFLFFLPLVTDSESRFGRFHANQGLILLLASVVGYIAVAILSFILTLISWVLGFISTLLYLALSVVLVILLVKGIMGASSGKAERLPVIGKFNLLK